MLKVIVIEDNPDLSMLLDKVASDSGYDVDCVTQATTFEEVINWDDYDLILLDTGISKINVEAAKKMALSNANVCLMSVLSEDIIGGGLFSSTYDYFLQKPFKLDTVRNILSHSKTL